MAQPSATSAGVVTFLEGERQRPIGRGSLVSELQMLGRVTCGVEWPIADESAWNEAVDSLLAAGTIRETGEGVVLAVDSVAEDPAKSDRKKRERTRRSEPQDHTQGTLF